MTKRLILAFVFLSWHLVACSNGDSGISSEDVLPNSRISLLRKKTLPGLKRYPKK